MAAPLTTYKLIILYMLQHTETALTNSQISEFILDREYTNYFHLQQSISELEEAGLIQKNSLNNTSYYRLTPDGQSVLQYFEKDLSPEIRSEVKEFLTDLGCEMSKQLFTPAEYFAANQGSYSVRCQIVEKNISVVDLTMAAPSLEAAKSICLNWPDKYQTIYEKIMEELL